MTSPPPAREVRNDVRRSGLRTHVLSFLSLSLGVVAPSSGDARAQEHAVRRDAAPPVATEPVSDASDQDSGHAPATDQLAPGPVFLGLGGAPVVGVFELAAPLLQRFVLRGTMPLPPGFLLESDTSSPFLVRGPDGNVFEAQTEVVSRYSTTQRGADVVELLANVQLPQGVPPGSRVRFEVLEAPHAESPFVVPPSVVDLLRTQGALVMRTRDVFDNRYTADLLADLNALSVDVRRLRSGPVATQWRTYEDMLPVTPVTGAAATLPHMFGVHAYLTVWGDSEVVSLDLRVHNGHEGRNKTTPADDPLGKVYFREIELTVPAGWRVGQANPAPSTGPVTTFGGQQLLPLVTALPGNKLHVMPSQGHFQRRLVLYKEGAEATAKHLLEERGLAFCQDGANEDSQRFFSWWNPNTARYWAQNLPLPDLSYMETPLDSRIELEQEFDELQVALATGNPGPWPVVFGSYGWAHPYGHKVGNLQGGSEIVFFDGIKTAWGASREGYLTYQMTQRMYCERHATALYQQSGEPYHMEDWMVQGSQGPYIPTWVHMVPWLQLGDPWGFFDAPTFQVDAVAQQGRAPDYEAELLAFQWIDAQHLIRYTRAAKVLAWLGNDALAKDDLKLQAELCRASYINYPQKENGVTISTGMLTDKEYVQTHPNDGFIIDRGEGWIFDTVASYYALARPSWREVTYDWIADAVDLMAAGQSNCGGTLMSKPSTNQFQGQYRFVQSISECILQNGLWGLLTTAVDAKDPARAALLANVLGKSAHAMISPTLWSEAAHSPIYFTALGPFDQNLPSFCGFVPLDGEIGNDGWQTWNMLVFGFRLTGDPAFLIRATEMAGGVLTPASMGLDPHPGELETRAGMISFLQTILGL